MAEADILKEFLVSVGFKVDDSSTAQLQRNLGKAKQHVDDFSKSTAASTTFLEKFFNFFQKSEGPMRQHTETTDRLTKSFTALHSNIKLLSELVAAGALSQAFLSLNKNLEDLYYSAQRAGTSVQILKGIRFGAEQVGISGDVITGAVTSLRRALELTPGLTQFAKALGADVVDPITGKVKEMGEATNIIIKRLGEIYRSNALGPSIARKAAEMLHVPFSPDIELLLKNPELFNKLIEQEKLYADLARRIGIDQDVAATSATNFRRSLRELQAVIDLLVIGAAQPFIKPITEALIFVEKELLSFNDIVNRSLAGVKRAFEQGGFEGVGEYLADTLTSVNWTKLGHDAADGFIAGFKELLTVKISSDVINEAIVGAGKGFANETLNSIRQGMQQVPILRDYFPGVGEPQKNMPGHAYGGTVKETGPIMAHAGEEVLTARTTERLTDWLLGSTTYRPRVIIENINELVDSLRLQDMSGSGSGNLVAGGALSRAFGQSGSHAQRASNATFQAYASYLSSQYGLDAPHIQAALANVLAESGGDPTAVGAGGDTGLFQHVGSRKKALFAYLSSVGASLNNAFAQLDFFMKEIQSRDPGWLGPGSADYLTRRFENRYEGPLVQTGRIRDLTDMQAILGGAALGTTNNYKSGDRTVTLNAQNNFHVHGDDAAGVGGAINSAIGRTNADLVRNLTTAVQ